MLLLALTLAGFGFVNLLVDLLDSFGGKNHHSWTTPAANYP